VVFQWFVVRCLYARIPDCFDCAPAEGNFMQGAAGDFVISRSRKRDRGAFFASRVGHPDSIPLEQNQSKRALAERMRGGFFLRKKPL